MANNEKCNGKVSCKAKLAIEKSSEEEVWSLVDETMENIKHRYPDLYQSLVDELETIAFRISYTEARQIVRGMKPRGEVYSKEETERLLQQYGIDYKCPIEYYLCINMMANDYYDTARKFNLAKDDQFYLCLAKDFIDDVDGKPFKVQRYFLD